MVSILGKKNFIFPKEQIAVEQLLACSLQRHFRDEIKCLRIIKRLNLDNGPPGKSANGQICKIGGGELARVWGGVN